MTITALPPRTWPTPNGDDGMNPLPPQPKQFLRIGRPPQLPRRERQARLLTRLGVYLLAWAAVGVGCWWIALGDSAGFGFIGLAALSTLLIPTRVPRRVRVRSRARRRVFPLRAAHARGRLGRLTSPGHG